MLFRSIGYGILFKGCYLHVLRRNCFCRGKKGNTKQQRINQLPGGEAPPGTPHKSQSIPMVTRTGVLVIRNTFERELGSRGEDTLILLDGNALVFPPRIIIAGGYCFQY